MSRSGLKGCWTRRQADVAMLTLIALAFCLAFGWALVRGKFLIGGDVFFDTYPLRTVAWDMIRHGQLPLWTPHVWSGYPLVAMASLGLGYPLTWLHLFLPSHWAEEAYVLAPFLLAPLFTYAYVRQLGRSHVAALLAGLSFGYGGLTTNTYGMNGQPTNALMWLPLLLIVLERTRQTSLVRCIVGATLIYSGVVLTGHAHSALQVATIGFSYALFLTLTKGISLGNARREEQENINGADPAVARAGRAVYLGLPWRPLAVCLVSIALGCGVAAFQILETMRAVRRSIRATISYDFFSAGGFTPGEALRSLAAPLYHYIEVTTYQAPLVCVLAVAAIVCAVRGREWRDARIFFWLAVALVAFVCLLGGHTPVYQWLYRVPVFNLFRRPSRYAFEWTFSLSILASYGWDALHSYAAAGRTRGSQGGSIKLLGGLLLLLLSSALAVQWWRAIRRGAIETSYLHWKVWFTVATALTIGYSWRALAPVSAKRLATATLLLVCLIEPLILIDRWWPGTAKSASRLTTPSLSTRWLQQFPPTEQRVYVRANGPDEETASQPRFDALDRTALFGLHNVAGYQPLILDRYSRALGNVEFDALSPRPGFAATRDLFEARSLVLDLLNAGYAVVWPNLDVMPESKLIEREGVRFGDENLGVTVAPGQSVSLRGAAGAGDQLVLVTSLANSVVVAQGAVVARLRVFTDDGQVLTLNLRAGLETAEWAHERADVRVAIRHQLAPIFDSSPSDEAKSYPAHRYWARLPLSARVSIKRIEIENVTPLATLALWKVTLYDARSAQSTPLTNTLDVKMLDKARWQVAADFNGVLVLRNQRALPRAWLVAEAEAVDGEEALRRIRGEGSVQFDPRRTALIEAHPNDLPMLPGGAVAPASSARIVKYAANELTIETSATTATVLVVSEIFYPGWVALIDGQKARIMSVDYLLRGVALPAGAHRVELRYAAPAARSGAIISVLTLLLLAGLAIFTERSRRKPNA